MFKSARWKSEKNKVKVVFKLLFHAAKLPQVGEDALMISVVPADVGKPTVKSDKAAVRDGSCFWENPVYETVKFNRDPKLGKIHERIYYFVVGTGSSKVGVIGEASIDFSNYAEATKVSLVSLPLKNSRTEAVLHVSIQRMQESVDHRDVEESETPKSNYKEHSLMSHLSNGDIDGNIKDNSEDVPFNKITEFNGNRRASNGSDITMSSSESSSGVESVQREPGGLVSSLRPQGLNSDAQTAVYEEHQSSHWGWPGNPALEASTDDSSSTPREIFLQQHLEEASDIVIEKLKSEVAALSRQAEISELELQTLRKQIVKESKRGQDLYRELVCLKEERDSLKGECERLKAARRRMDEAKTRTNSEFEGGDLRVIVEELRQELNHAKELNANLQVQLQKTQESNSELILAVQDLDEMLEQKNREILSLSSEVSVKDIDDKTREAGATGHRDEDNDDEEQKALEELVKEHVNAKESYLLEQQIMDLRSEIEIYKRDKDELEMQMEQLALDYEIMKQENHEMAYKLEQSQLQEQLKMQYECSSSYAAAHELEAQIENLENELKIQKKESADALVTINVLEAQKEHLENELKKRTKESVDALVVISELEAHVKSLEDELEKQSQGFEADLEALMCSKVEQEQRAIRAEEAFRKTRWQNANTAERLQEEFRRLSVQMASTLEANEKLATKALAEANELRLQKIHLEDMIQKASEEHQSVKEDYESRLYQLANQVVLMTKQIEQMQSEIEDRELQLEYQKKHAEETERLLSDEILKLKNEIDTYIAKNKILSEEVEAKESLMHELEQMRLSVKEMKLLMEQGNDERIELESRIMLLKSEAEELQKELNKASCLLEEKELTAGTLQSELDSLKAQYTELKHSLLEDELEKVELRKQVVLLKDDLKKAVDALSSMEMKIKDAATLDADEATSETSTPVPCGSKEAANLKGKIKLLEDQIKLKESALEISSNTFLEKEKDLHNKIEEFEERLVVLDESSIRYCENEVEKVAQPAEDEALNLRLNEEERNSDEDSSTTSKISDANNSTSTSINSNTTNDTGYLDELKNEMALLRDRNESMEAELKEMQGRYSELSLKFAEVEGERQQLVMRVRYLKNAKKRS
ncbi:paramyosin [Sesamum indicum]|uniref:Paramyosin n=1 Tax=Sesamum indicum TaxID=4182 RepID=A0A6I9TBL6_SESIN|nr:paramyosin [Sesamum indicum]